MTIDNRMSAQAEKSDSSVALHTFQKSSSLEAMTRDPAETNETQSSPTDSSSANSIRSSFEDEHENDGVALPQADGGLAAWLFLAGCFIIEALVWGFPFAYGIFQDYYSTHEPFKSQGNVAAIGTTAMGIMYIGLPIAFSMLLVFPRSRRISTVVGLVIMCISLAASSFSKTTTDLILSQGVAYAVGGSLTYAPAIIFIDEWFIRRKGFAYGVMWAGTGLAGFVLPFVMEWALNKFGYQTVLRAWAIALFVLTAPLLYFVRPRIPNSKPRRFTLNFVLNPSFLLLQFGNVIEGLGFFLPSLYLPSYAIQLGASPYPATLTIVLFNLASVIGCIIMGQCVDRFHVTTCILISTIGSTLSVFLFWGLSGGLPLLYIFCIIYGLFAGSFTSTWPGIMSLVNSKVARAEPTMVFAFLSAGRGIGNVVSGPLSETLIKGGSAWAGAKFGYGSQYGPVIVFTGVTALLGGIGVLGRLKKGFLDMPRSSDEQ